MALEAAWTLHVDGRTANSLPGDWCYSGVPRSYLLSKELFPEKEIVEFAEGFYERKGAYFLITEDATKLYADVLLHSTWVSTSKKIIWVTCLNRVINMI